MSQILTIFKKDARHLWPEIVVSLLVTVALVRFYPVTWAPQQYPNILLGRVASALIVLLPMSWWILITRLIHDETLVGDRQFWLTRPYQWKLLLAAKALFLLVFLYLPTFIAHAALLVEAGFHPASYLTGLLYNLLLITGIIILPLVSLATVTSNFAKMTLAMVGILVGMLGLVTLAAVLSVSGANVSGDDNHLSFALFFSVFLAVIIVQYATRKTWLSRALLAGVAVVVVSAELLYPDDFFVRRSYPQPIDARAPVQLAYLSQAQVPITVSGDFDREKQVSVSIPINVSGFAAGRAIAIDNVRVTLDALNGLHWQSRWQGVYLQHLLPDTSITRISFRVDRDFFHQIQSMPVSIQLSLALTELQPGETIRTVLSEREKNFPGIGICALERVGLTTDFYSVSCRSALRWSPRLAYVQSYWSKRHCSDTPPTAAEGVFGDTWIGSLDTAPADFSIAPVSLFGMRLSNQFSAAEAGSPPHPSNLCPGTPLSVTYYTLSRRTQLQVTLHDLHLPPPTKSAMETYK